MTSLLILSLNTYVHPQNSFVISAVCSFSALCQHVCPSSKQLCHPLYHCMPSLLFLCIMSTHLSILKTALSSTVCQVCSFSALCQHVCPSSKHHCHLCQVCSFSALCQGVCPSSKHHCHQCCLLILCIVSTRLSIFKIKLPSMM